MTRFLSEEKVLEEINFGSGQLGYNLIDETPPISDACNSSIMVLLETPWIIFFSKHPPLGMWPPWDASSADFSFGFGGNSWGWSTHVFRELHPPRPFFQYYFIWKPEVGRLPGQNGQLDHETAVGNLCFQAKLNLFPLNLWQQKLKNKKRSQLFDTSLFHEIN